MRQLLSHLGYDRAGEHRGGRRLVFVGDLCDRGPDSPAVMILVQDLMQRGLAQCVLGNHELNLLRQERKSGNGWAFEQHPDHTRPQYADCRRATAREREDLRRFCATLPLALERADLRITHAAWHEESLSLLQDHAGAGTLERYLTFERRMPDLLPTSVRSAADREWREWLGQLRDPQARVPLLENLALRDEIYQRSNPVRVLTSGLEERTAAPFFAAGRWRMLQRVSWWASYHERPVIVGHYWRWWNAAGAQRYSHGGPDIFAPAGPLDWMGPAQAVYCVDFSVGARFRETADGLEPGSVTRLGAVRWPENEIVFDNGERHELRRL